MINLIFLFTSLSSFTQNPLLPQCDVPNYIDSPSCKFITNGDFSYLLDPIEGGGEISDANWWNTHSVTNACINPNWGYPADIFSGSLGATGWTDGVNIYSNGVSVTDPTGDGNFAAINVYEDPNNGANIELTYIEQELAEFLYPGFGYEISFKVRRAEVSSRSSDIGVYFTTDYLANYSLQLNDPPNSTILSHPLSASTDWETITIPFTIDEQVSPIPLKYITIGQRNGGVDQILNSNQFPAGSGEYKGYYFIDDIKLQWTSSVNEDIDLVFCNQTGLINIAAVHPNSTGVWTLVSGVGTLVDPTSNSVYLEYSSMGNYTLQYSYSSSPCDTLLVEHIETFNIIIEDVPPPIYNTLRVCDDQVVISSYTNGLDGEWTIEDGEGSVSSPYYSGYGIGYSTLLFTPTPGQYPCQVNFIYLTIEYTPFPKTTIETYSEDVWNDVVKDVQGNIYVVGTFKSFTELDGNVISNEIDPNAGKTQFMVAKYDPCGLLLWYTWGLAHCTNGGKSTGTSIAIDEQYKRVYISGKSWGMLIKYSDGGVWDVLNASSTPQIQSNCNDSEMEAYVLELDSETGHYEDFVHHIAGITTINSLAVAIDGVFGHFLYLGGALESISNTNSSIVKFETNPNFNANNNLSQIQIPYIASSAFNNTINDIYYKNQTVYAVGTTFGSFVLDPLQVNVNLQNGSSTSWAAMIYDDFSGFNAISIGHGGDSYIPFERIMTGDQIYVNDHNEIIIAGLYSGYMGGPYSGSFDNESPSIGIQPVARDMYLFKLFQGGPNLILQGDPEHTDFISCEVGMPEVSKVALTGDKDKIYIAATYSGKELYFKSTNETLDVSSLLDANEGEKIMISHYNTYPYLSKVWHSTTLDMDQDGQQNVEAICAYNNKVYTVGNYEKRMNFNYDNYGPIDYIYAISGKPSAFIFRNDNFFNGGFKSLHEITKNKPTETEDVSIYPNPSKGIVYIEGDMDFNLLSVSDISGRQIPFSKSIEHNKVILNFGSFKGLAIVSVQNKSYRILIQ